MTKEKKNREEKMKNNIFDVIFIAILSLMELVGAAFWISAYAVPAIVAGNIFSGVVGILTALIWIYWGFSHLNELKEGK